MEDTLGKKFLMASLIYFAITVTMGATMTIEPIYRFTVLSSMFQRAHAHIGLIGWVSLSIIGFIYISLKNIDKSMYSERLGNMGLWLLNIGISFEFIVLLLGGYNQAYLYAYQDPSAHASTIPFTMFTLIFALVMIIGAYMTVYNLYKTLKG